MKLTKDREKGNGHVPKEVKNEEKLSVFKRNINTQMDKQKRKQTKRKK